MSQAGTIPMICPECGYETRVKGEYAELKLLCKKCDTPLERQAGKPARATAQSDERNRRADKVRLECPQCGKSYRVAKEKAAKKFRCKVCKVRLKPIAPVESHEATRAPPKEVVGPDEQTVRRQSGDGSGADADGWQDAGFQVVGPEEKTVRRFDDETDQDRVVREAPGEDESTVRMTGAQAAALMARLEADQDGSDGAGDSLPIREPAVAPVRPPEPSEPQQTAGPVLHPEPVQPERKVAPVRPPKPAEPERAVAPVRPPRREMPAAEIPGQAPTDDAAGHVEAVAPTAALDPLKRRQHLDGPSLLGAAAGIGLIALWSHLLGSTESGTTGHRIVVFLGLFLLASPFAAAGWVRVSSGNRVFRSIPDFLVAIAWLPLFIAAVFITENPKTRMTILALGYMLDSIWMANYRLAYRPGNRLLTSFARSMSGFIGIFLVVTFLARVVEVGDRKNQKSVFQEILAVVIWGYQTS